MAKSEQRVLPVTRQTFVVEAFFLPLAAVLTSTGLAAALFRAAAVTTGLVIGLPPYVLIFAASVAGTTMTTLRSVLGLPHSIRLIDFSAIHIVSALVLNYIPYAYGSFRFAAMDLPVTPMAIGIFAVQFAWLFGTWLAWVVAKVFPVHVQQPEDQVLAERLDEEGQFRAVYTGSVYSILAQRGAWREAYNVTLSIILFYLGLTIFIPQAYVMRTDTPLAVWSGITFAGLMAYLGLTQLCSRRRTAERRGNVIMPPGYTAAWGLAIWVPTVVAIGLGSLLPANISPFDSVDYNAIMDRVTKFLVGLFFQPRGSGSYFRDPVTGGGGYTGRSSVFESIPPAYGGSGGMSGLGPLIILSFPVIAYVLRWLYKRVREHMSIPIADEVDKSRGLWAIIKAILLWPFRALASLFRHLVGEDIIRPRHSAESVAHQVQRGRKARRRRWLYPDDPALFVRFVYGRFLSNAARAGQQRRHNQTALEYARSVAMVFPDAEIPVEDLTQTYCNVRYATQEPEVGVRARVMGHLRSIQRSFRDKRRYKEAR